MNKQMTERETRYLKRVSTIADKLRTSNRKNRHLEERLGLAEAKIATQARTLSYMNFKARVRNQEIEKLRIERIEVL